MLWVSFNSVVKAPSYVKSLCFHSHMFCHWILGLDSFSLLSSFWLRLFMIVLLCFGLALEKPAPKFAGDVISLLSRSSWSATELPKFQISSWKLWFSARSHTRLCCSLQSDSFKPAPGYGGARISTNCTEMGFEPSCLIPKLNNSWIPSSNLAAVWIYEPCSELPRLLLTCKSFLGTHLL